ncbi:MAG: hypothetical protein JOZ98_19885 [Solirubrobacterales bacterium]|nr:hypothetical protein [Solirubrobacterales bacterium]
MATSGLAPAGGGTRRVVRAGVLSANCRGSGTVHTLVFLRAPVPMTSTSSPEASSACRARR